MSLVHASASTWHRVIKQFELKRSGKRYYPAKPRVGIRASAPNQIWHLDLSVIKLKDGTRCYIQALIDNFSRIPVGLRI
jgi:transposase InsO family protein